MGYIEEDESLLDPKALGRLVGPTVHLMTNDPASSEWFGTVLIACHADVVPQEGARLTFSTAEQQATDVQGRSLYTQTYAGAVWSVVRFDIKTRLCKQATHIQYSIKIPGLEVVPSGKIPLAAAGANWHVAAYSCNDQRQLPKTGINAWLKLKKINETNPFHLIMGTGDQLYNDNVWHVDACKRWAAIEDKAVMRETALTAEEEQQVKDYYFGAYLRWMKFHPLADDLASLPQVNTWDDHDIFDGYGSYPDTLQHCATFQQLFGVAKSLYALFQLHTTDALKGGDGYFSTPQDDGLSWSMMLGPRLAVAALDTRSGRTRKQIVPATLIDELCRRIDALPPSVEHLVLVSAVPVAYPEVTAMEQFMKGLQDKSSLLVKTGLFNKLMNEFGEPELLDDILDHWSSSAHCKEKEVLLGKLRDFARARGCRITLLSGDVHQAVYCFTSSTPTYTNLVQDPGFMPQLVSSAIGYNPPANPVTVVLDQYSGNAPREVIRAQGGGPALYETVAWLFKDKAKRPSISTRFANRNNFCELSVATERSGPFAGMPLLHATYHVRQGTLATDGPPDTDAFDVVIPPLLQGNEVKPEVAKLLQDRCLGKLMPPEPANAFYRYFCCCCAYLG